jgi:hypothetical protein
VGASVLLRDGSRSVTGTLQFDTGSLSSNVAAGGAGVGFTLNTLASYIAGDKLLSLKNNGTLEAFFDHLGRLFVDADLTTKSQFGLTTGSVTIPRILLDSGDYIQFDRTANTFGHFVASVEKLRVGSSSVTIFTPLSVNTGLILTAPSTFVDLDTTPSILNKTFWLASNSLATSITDFDDEIEDGNVITILFTTANTTIVNGATIRNRSAANITPATNATHSYIMRSGVWHETS